MKRYFTTVILILLILLLFSCDNSSRTPEKEPENEQPGEQEPLQPDTGIADSKSYIACYSGVSENSVIELMGLRPYQIYSVYAESNGSAKKRSSFLPGFYNTGVGTKLFLSDGNGNIRFTGADLGIRENGIVKIKNITGYYDDLIIDENIDSPVEVYIDGFSHKLYEELCVIKTDDYKKQYGIDLSEVAVLSILSRGGSGSTDIGLIRNIDDFLSDRMTRNAYSLLDISDYGNVRLYNGMAIRNANQPWSQELRLVNPIDLTEEEQAIKETSCVYRINPSSKDVEYVIDITTGDGYGRNAYPILNDKGNPRYYNGTRRKNLFPLTYKDDSIVMYVGKVDEPFLIDFYMNIEEGLETAYGSIKLRPITNEEQSYIQHIYLADGNNEISELIKIPAWSDSFLPIMIDATDDSFLSNFEIIVECNDPDCSEIEDKIMLVAILGHEEGIGYSKRSLYLNDDTSIVPDGNDSIEYCYIRTYSPEKEHEMNIRLVPLN